MEWERLKTEIEEVVGLRLDMLQSNLEKQQGRLMDTISKVQSFAEILKHKLPNGIEKVIQEEPQLSRAQTTRTHHKTEFAKTQPIDIKKIGKELIKKADEDKKKDEAKVKADEKKAQLEEAKKKKLEEAKKKKDEEESKKKEALIKKKEEDERKKEEAKRKAEELKEKKRQEELEKKLKQEEAKKKLEEEKEKKKLEEVDKKNRAEEAKKKSEESKKKSEEEKKSKISEQKKVEEEKKKKLDEEKKKKLEEEKKKKVDDKKKPEENKKKSVDEKKNSEEKSNEELKSKTSNKPPVSSDTSKLGSSSLSSIKNEEMSSCTEPSTDQKLETPPSDLSKSETVKFETGKNESSSPSTSVQLKPEPALEESKLSNSSLPSLEEIAIQLKNMKSSYSEEELITEKSFDLSVGAKSALSLLTTMDDDKFYLDRMPREEVIWTFRLFFILLNQELPANDQEAWKVCQEFLADARNKEKNRKTIDKFIIEVINKFNFSDENIDKIEEIVYGKDNLLQPQYYTDFCALTGLLMFGVREAAIFGGAIKGKVPIWRQYKRLIHKQQQLENKLLS